MRKVFPYINLHVPLNFLDEHLVLSRIEEVGYYCVFWWNEIPLGQLFIEKGQMPDKDVLYEKVLYAIEPAIEFYIAKQHLTDIEYKKAFHINKELFSREMERLFYNFIPVTLPESVDVSIIICTRNRSAQLQLCLEKLKNQRCLPREIVVVDNAPADDSSQLVVEKYPEIIYYKESRPGLDIARNAGARLAKGSIVAYVDDDVFVHPLWTYRTWESFVSKEITAITGLVIAASLETEAQQIFEKFWSFNRGFEDKIFDSKFFEKNLKEGPPVWEIGAGANMAFRKSVFEQVGYFDERLDVGAAGCSGDSEMWYRILDSGGTILYSPRSVVYHEHRKELHQLHKQLFNYMRGFAAAALIQQDRNKRAGYRKRIFNKVPKDYLKMVIRAFPRYSFQNKTLLSEIRGVISGVLFYYRNKNIS